VIVKIVCGKDGLVTSSLGGTWLTNAERGTIYLWKNGKVVWDSKGKGDSEFFIDAEYIILLGKSDIDNDYNLAVYEAKEPLKITDPADIPGIIDFLDALVVRIRLTEPVGVWLHTPYGVGEYGVYKRSRSGERWC